MPTRARASEALPEWLTRALVRTALVPLPSAGPIATVAPFVARELLSDLLFSAGEKAGRKVQKKVTGEETGIGPLIGGLLLSAAADIPFRGMFPRAKVIEEMKPRKTPEFRPSVSPGGRYPLPEYIPYREPPEVNPEKYPMMYHVTTRTKGVEESGSILPPGILKESGEYIPALGGKHGRFVSLTPKREEAANIYRQLVRAIKFARGELGLEDLPRIAEEDARIHGLPKHVADALRDKAKAIAEDAMEAYKKIKEDYERMGIMAGVGIRDFTLTRFKHYLQSRENIAGISDPMILSGRVDLSKLTPEDVSIVAYPTRRLMEFTKGYHYPLMTSGADTWTEEVELFGNLPMFKGTKRVRAAPGTGTFAPGL